MAGDTLHRKIIRDGTKALLLSNTDAGEDVSIGRATSIFKDEEPHIGIYTPEDIPQTPESHPTNFPRKIQLIIEVLVQKKAGQLVPEDVADKVMGQIEDILLPNIYLQNPPPKQLQSAPFVTPGPELVENLRLVSITDGKTDEGSQDVYGLIGEFEVIFEYERKQGNVDDFETGEATYDLEGTQEPGDMAEDEFAIPQS